MRDMKRIVISERSRFRCLHVEAPGCIVNIRFGLMDQENRNVTAIEILPDDRYAGEPAWFCDGHRNIRVIQEKETKP